MPTNLGIDEELLNEALKVGGQRTKTETVNAALREFVNRRRQGEVVMLFGTIDYLSDYDYKKARRRSSR